MQSKSVAESNLLYVVRHGERQDEAQEESELDYDPGVTELGKQQARVTGQYFKKQLQEQNISQLTIMSSPTLRCVMTAAIIAKELGQGKIIVNNLLLPKQSIKKKMPDHFSRWKGEDYLINKRNKDEFIKEYLDGIDYELKIEADEKNFPENNQIHSSRVQMVLDDVKQSLTCNEYGKAVIIAAQSSIVKQMCQNFGCEKQEEIYCCYAQASYNEQENWKLNNCGTAQQLEKSGILSSTFEKPCKKMSVLAKENQLVNQI